MKGLAFSSLRVGKRYRLINFDESCEFLVELMVGKDDFEIKDLNNLERCRLKDLFKFGKGKDFEIREID